MALQAREQEILFTGGMNSKEHAELQDVSSMRELYNLRFDELGRLSKRPTHTEIATPYTSGSVYSGHLIEACFSRQGEACALTNHKGVQRYTGTSTLKPTHELATASTALSASLRYAPKACSVARRPIASAQFGVTDQAIMDTASAIYNGDVLVVAWLSVVTSASVALNAKAIDLATGATLHEVRQSNVTSALTAQVSACEYTESGKEGVVIAYAYGSSAPYTVAYIRYDAASQKFVAGGNLTTNARSTGIALAKSGTSLVFAFTDDTTTFLKVQTRTVTTVASTHDSTKADAYAPALVVGATYTWVLSLDTTHAYIEPLGTPASITTFETYSGSVTPVCIAAALETRTSQTDAISVWVGVYDSTFLSLASLVALKGYFTRVGYAYMAAGPTPSAAMQFTEPHTTPITSGFSVNGRAYCGLWATAEVVNEQTSILVACFDWDTTRSHVVARAAHDRAALIPVTLREVPVSGTTAYLPFLADLAPYTIQGGSYKYPQSVFVSEVDFAARPLPYLEIDGVSMVASGMLFEYDGTQAYEASPMNRPLMHIDGASGTGQTGTFSFLAMYKWVDSQGRLHRSAPSASLSTTVANKQIDVYVSIPPFTAYSNSVRTLDVELYATENGGSTYYLCSSSSKKDTYDTTFGAFTAIWYKFTAVAPSATSAIEPYSAGEPDEELPSEAPPSFCSIARVGDRVWGVDAEDRARLWFSKPLVAGFGVEWNAVNTLYIGDQGVAVVDVNGTPTVLGKAGIWQVYGDGPNALGVGSFAPARRLPHEVECMSSTGLCKTPQGVMFRGRRGVYLLGVGLDLQPIGLAVDPSMQLGDDTASYWARLVYDERHNEVRVIDSVNDVFVINAVENKWTRWEQGWGIANATTIDACTVLGRVWEARTITGGSQFARELGVDEANHNLSTLLWRITTPWVKLDGVAGFTRLWRMLFSLMFAADTVNLSSLTVSMSIDFNDAEVDEFTWTGAQLDAIQGADDVVLERLKMHPSIQRMSAFRLTITETPQTAYAGSIPLSVRLQYGVRAGGYKRVQSGAQKGAA